MRSCKGFRCSFGCDCFWSVCRYGSGPGRRNPRNPSHAAGSVESRRHRRIHERIRPLKIDNLCFRRHRHARLADSPGSLQEEIFESRENGHAHVLEPGDHFARPERGDPRWALATQTQDRQATRTVHPCFPAPTKRLADRARSHLSGCAAALKR